MEYLVIQRVKQFIEFNKISIREFERLCMFPNGTINKAKQTLSPDRLEKIFLQYPNLNKAWLLTGEGSMFNDTELSASKKSNLKDIGIPYYMKNIRCGRGVGFKEALTLDDADGYAIIPELKKLTDTFLMKSYGRSMVDNKHVYRSIPEGSWVALQPARTDVVRWGEVYGLATEDGFMIKKVMPSERDGYVTLLSSNEEEGYPPFEYPVVEIFDMALVVGVFSMQTW